MQIIFEMNRLFFRNKLFIIHKQTLERGNVGHTPRRFRIWKLLPDILFFPKSFSKYEQCTPLHVSRGVAHSPIRVRDASLSHSTVDYLSEKILCNRKQQATNLQDRLYLLFLSCRKGSYHFNISFAKHETSTNNKYCVWLPHKSQLIDSTLDFTTRTLCCLTAFFVPAGRVQLLHVHCARPSYDKVQVADIHYVIFWQSFLISEDSPSEKVLLDALQSWNDSITGKSICTSIEALESSCLHYWTASVRSDAFTLSTSFRILHAIASCVF